MIVGLAEVMDSYADGSESESEAVGMMMIDVVVCVVCVVEYVDIVFVIVVVVNIAVVFNIVAVADIDTFVIESVIECVVDTDLDLPDTAVDVVDIVVFDY